MSAAIAKAAACVNGKPLPPGVVAGEPVNPQRNYYAADGTFMNADGTRSIFDDVDEDGTEPAGSAT